MPLLVFVYPFSPSECVIEEKMTYTGYNIDIGGKGKYGGTVVENKEACAKLSFSTKGAKYWSFLPAGKLCWVKTSRKGRRPHPTVVSGNRLCGKPGTIKFQPSIVSLLLSHNQFHICIQQQQSRTCKLAGKPKRESREYIGKASKPFLEGDQ